MSIILRTDVFDLRGSIAINVTLRKKGIRLLLLDFVTLWHILAYNFQTVHILIYYLESSGKKY